MLEYNLQDYKCPQLFIQFKLGLRKADMRAECIQFKLHKAQSIDDIHRYLQKYQYQYKLDKQQWLLTVEPKRA